MVSSFQISLLYNFGKTSVYLLCLVFYVFWQFFSLTKNSETMKICWNFTHFVTFLLYETIVLNTGKNWIGLDFSFP